MQRLKKVEHIKKLSLISLMCFQLHAESNPSDFEIDKSGTLLYQSKPFVLSQIETICKGFTCRKVFIQTDEGVMTEQLFVEVEHEKVFTVTLNKGTIYTIDIISPSIKWDKSFHVGDDISVLSKPVAHMNSHGGSYFKINGVDSMSFHSNCELPIQQTCKISKIVISY